MSSSTITIAKFNGSNYKQWSGEMALLLEQKVVWGVIEGYDTKPPTPATDAAVTEIKEYKEWMNRHGIAWPTILLGMEPRLQNEYMDVKDAKELWEKLATTYRTKLQLNIFDIREGLLNLRLEDCETVDSYVSKIDEKVSAYNLCADSTGTTATGGDDSDTIPKISKQEHVFYLLRGVPRNDDWKVFLEILRNRPDIHAKPEEVVTKLAVQEAAIKREKGMSADSDVLLFTKTQRKSQARKHRKGRSNEKDTESDSDSSDEKRGRNAARRDGMGCYERNEIGHIVRFCPKKRPAETTGVRGRSAGTTDTGTAAMATSSRIWSILSSITTITCPGVILFALTCLQLMPTKSRSAMSNIPSAPRMQFALSNTTFENASERG